MFDQNVLDQNVLEHGVGDRLVARVAANSAFHAPNPRPTNIDAASGANSGGRPRAPLQRRCRRMRHDQRAYSSMAWRRSAAEGQRYSSAPNAVSIRQRQ